MHERHGRKSGAHREETDDRETTASGGLSRLRGVGHSGAANAVGRAGASLADVRGGTASANANAGTTLAEIEVYPGCDLDSSPEPEAHNGWCLLCQHEPTSTSANCYSLCSIALFSFLSTRVNSLSAVAAGFLASQRASKRE